MASTIEEGPTCCISGWSWRSGLNLRMWLCLHHTARAMNGRAVLACSWRQHWWALWVSRRSTRHCCWSLQSVKLGKDKCAGGWKVTLGSDLRTEERLSQKLSLHFSSINLSTEVSISFLFIPIFSERLCQPFRVTRLKRLSLCLTRLFYIPETLLLFWWSSPGAVVVGRRQTVPQAGQVISCCCSGHLLEEPKAERWKI